MQMTIVVVIVAAAAVLLGRRLFNSIKKGGRATCGCGGSECGCESHKHCVIPTAETETLKTAHPTSGRMRRL